MALVLPSGKGNIPFDLTTEIKGALRDFEAILTNDERIVYQTYSLRPNASSAIAAIAEIDANHVSRASRCVGARLYTFLEAVQQFAGVVDTFAGAQPDIAQQLWGCIKFTINAVSNDVSYFDKVTTMIMRVSRENPKYADYNHLYPGCTGLQYVLCKYYTTFIHLFIRLLQRSRQSRPGSLSSNLLVPFESDFKTYLGDLDDTHREIRFQISLATKTVAQEDAGLLVYDKEVSEPSQQARTGQDQLIRRAQQMKQEMAKTRSTICGNLSHIDHAKPWRQALKQKVPGTADWIQRDPTFLKWSQSTSTTVLWISGVLGSGKTVLASNIVTYLVRNAETIAYFFCRSDLGESLKSHNILGSVARQLLDHEIEQRDSENLSVLLQESRELAATDILKKQFKLEKPCYIVIDGLDECSNDEIRKLSREISKLQNVQANLKVLLTGRPELATQLHILPDLKISLARKETEEDVHRYVDFELGRCLEDGSLVLEDPTTILEIAEAIKKNWDRIFLSRLAIEEVCMQRSDQYTIESLGYLPLGLARLLDPKIAKVFKSEACPLPSRILQYCGVAKRPLTIHELQEAIGLEIGQESLNKSTIPLDMQMLLSECAGLVYLDEEDETVHFAHPSIRRYLFQSPGPHSIGFVEEDINKHFGYLSMTYLNFRDFDRQLVRSKQKSAPSINVQESTSNHMTSNTTTSPIARKLLRLNPPSSSVTRHDLEWKTHEFLEPSQVTRAQSQSHTYYFLSYAREHWYSHLQDLDENDEMWPMFKTCVTTDKGGLISHPWESYHPNPKYRISKGSSIRDMLWGLVNNHGPFLKVLVSTKPIEVILQDVGILINSAVVQRNVSLILTAIGLGFLGVANMAGLLIGDSRLLHFASLHGYFKVVQSLIENGADINLQDERYGSALQAAAEKGHVDIVMLLLERGADVNMQNGSYGSALQAASATGEATIVQLLIDNGANVNVRGGKFGSALAAASINSHKSVVEILLKHLPPGDSPAEHGPRKGTQITQSAVMMGTLPMQSVPATDSGYASRSPWKADQVRASTLEDHSLSSYERHSQPLLKEVNESVPNEFELGEVQTTYSDSATFTTTMRDSYIYELAENLSGVVFSERGNSQAMERITNVLPGLLQSFALRLGLCSTTQMNRDIMVFIHKYRSQIVEAFRKAILHKTQNIDDISQLPSERIPLEDIIQGWHERLSDPEDECPFDESRSSIQEYHDLPYSPSNDNKEDIENSETQHKDDEDEIKQHDDNDRREEEELAMPGLLKYREIFFKSPEYKWLLGRLHQELYLDVEGAQSRQVIRNKIHCALASQHKISRSSPAQIYRVTVELEWALLAFIKEQAPNEDPRKVVETAITLTGSASNAQALSCAQYLDQTWPTSGKTILGLVKAVVHDGYGRRKVCNLSDGSKLAAWHNGSTFVIESTGTRDAVTEVCEQFAWLGAALRTSHAESELCYCTPEISDIVVLTSPSEQPGSPLMKDVVCKIDFVQEQVSKNDEAWYGRCWHNMFRNPTLVKGFPVLRRVISDTGLEMPLDMMAALVRTKHIDTFNDQFYLKGYSSMLFPTQKIDNCLFWHLLFKEDGSRISYLDSPLHDIEEICLPILDSFRHIIGWCSQARNYAGAPDANYDIRRSLLPHTSPGCVLEKVSVSGGKVISGGATFSVFVKDTPIYLPQEEYVLKLQWISKQFVVLWDECEKRGWLVNGASALLHLVRTSLKENEKDNFSFLFLLKSEEIQEAAIPYTSESALEVLSNPANMKLKIYPGIGETYVEETSREGGEQEQLVKTKNTYYRLENRIERLCKVLEKIIEYQIHVSGQSGTKLELRARKHLEGWNFWDIATENEPIYPQVTTLDMMRKGWVDFTRSIQAPTLFGRGFGNIIQPAKSALCSYWSVLPVGKSYLAASVSDLQTIMKLKGDPQANPPMLSPTIMWHNPDRITGPCQCTKGGKHEHSDFVQVLWPAKQRKSLLVTSSVPLHTGGAVIFGHKMRFKWYSADVRDPVPGELPVTCPESESQFIDSGIGSSLTPPFGREPEELTGSGSVLVRQPSAPLQHKTNSTEAKDSNESRSQMIQNDREVKGRVEQGNPRQNALDIEAQSADALIKAMREIRPAAVKLPAQRNLRKFSLLKLLPKVLKSRLGKSG